MVFDLECKTGFKPRLLLSLSGFGLISILMSLYTLGTSYYSVSGHGDWSIPGLEMVVWLCLSGIILMAICLCGLFVNKLRCSAMAALIGSGLMVIVGVASLKYSDTIRMQGFERLSVEAAPLVAAIHAFSKTKGHPPLSLNSLEVNFPQGHEIKGETLPEFQYLTGETARERYHGNPWVLLLETPTGPFKWDKFVYYPEQNYPSLGFGGWLERVGDWAYVHE